MLWEARTVGRTDFPSTLSYTLVDREIRMDWHGSEPCTSRQTVNSPLLVESLSVDLQQVISVWGRVGDLHVTAEMVR